MTQPEIILRFLNTVAGWIKSFNLRGVATEWGWIGSQGDKRARELPKDQGYNLDGSLKKYFRYRGRLLSGIGWPYHRGLLTEWNEVASLRNFSKKMKTSRVFVIKKWLKKSFPSLPSGGKMFLTFPG